MSKRRPAWATKVKLPTHRGPLARCDDCPMYYKGVVRDINEKVERELGCWNSCPIANR